jgi:hypothetical protein
VQAATAACEVEPGLVDHQLVEGHGSCLADLGRLWDQKVQNQGKDLGRHGLEAQRGPVGVWHGCIAKVDAVAWREIVKLANLGQVRDRSV